MTAAGLPGDDPAPVPRSAASRLLATTAWAVSTLVLALIALSALSHTAGMVGALLRDLPGPYGRLGLLSTAALLLGGLGLIVLARRLSFHPSMAGPRLPLLIVALAVVARVALALVVDAPLHGENRIIHEQALGVLDGACCFGHRPLGYPIVLAGAYAILGVGPGTVEGLNIAFAVVTTWLVWEIGRVTGGRHLAAVAATAYAVVPSQVLMTLVPLTEPMYTMLVAGAVRAAIALERRPVLLAAGATAALLAAGQYVRATAASLLAPIALLPWLVGWPFGRTVLRAVLVVGIFVVLMLPVVSYNLRAHGDVSVSTSAYGGWSLYVGANREHGGQWNAEDAERLAGFPGDTWWARSEHAGGLVGDRILEDPGGSLRLLPLKFNTLWGDEAYAAKYALSSGPITREIHVGWLVSQLAWAPLTLLAALGMLAARGDPRPAPLLIGMVITLVALTHLALEVHSRYHASLVPLLCLLAAGGVEAIVAWRRSHATG